MNKFIILILLSFVLQSDWLDESKKLISEIDKKAVIIDTKEIVDEDGIYSRIKHKTEKFQKTQVNIVHSHLIDIEMNFYEKEGFIFGIIMNGQDVLIYKSKLLESDPYATLIESRTYFKNETEGINLTRKINVHESDNIEDLKEALKKVEFETKILNSDDYERSRRKFEQMTTLKSK